MKKFKTYLFLTTFLLSMVSQAGGYAYCEFEHKGENCDATETDGSEPDSAHKPLVVSCGSYYYKNHELSAYSVSEGPKGQVWEFAIRGEKVSCFVID